MEESFSQQFQSPREQFSSSPPAQRQRRRVPRFVLLLFILLLLAGVGFGAMRFLGSNPTDTPAVIAPTPTPDVFPTDVPVATPTVAVTPVSSPSPTAIPTVNPIDKATGLDRSNLNVAVKNGSGEVGVASKMSEVLKSFGYHVVSVGNADNYNYEQVTINVKSSASKYLPLLKSDLAKQFTISSAAASLSASSSADAVVIIGK